MSNLNIRKITSQLHAALKLVCRKNKTPLEWFASEGDNYV